MAGESIFRERDPNTLFTGRRFPALRGLERGRTPAYASGGSASIVCRIIPIVGLDVTHVHPIPPVHAQEFLTMAQTPGR